jgi:hypothetical protein
MSWGEITFGFQRHAIIAPESPSRMTLMDISSLQTAIFFREPRETLKVPPAAGGNDIEVLHRIIVERGVRSVAELPPRSVG